MSLNVDMTVKLNSESNKAIKNFRSGFVFTHSGFSGPSILDISHWFTKDDTIKVLLLNFLNEKASTLCELGWSSKC